MGKKRAPVGLSGLGVELTAAVVGGLLVGLWIDRRYDTTPWAAVAGGMVGVIGGLVNFVRQARRAMNEATGSSPSPPSREDDAP